MSIFLTETEKQAVNAARGEPAFADLYWRFLNRATRWASQPGLRDETTTTEYWHMAFDYVSNAAMMQAIKPDPVLGEWVRAATLELARRPDEEWVGPWFRDHDSEPRNGHLETAHLAWACAVALDLAPDVFSDTERDEVRAKLRDVGIPLCRQFGTRGRHINNWACILNAGVAVPAAVLDSREDMDFAAEKYIVLQDLFQSDGTYGESLQYAHYAQIGQMLTYEALVRRDPGYAERLKPERYGRCVRWAVASHFYCKPFEGWGPYPRPVSANFNDSAALFQPPGDVLLHVSARCRDTLPDEASLARWYFDRCYNGERAHEPDDLASFGLFNHAGFLTLPLLTQSADAKPPAEAGLTPLEAFSTGDVIARDELDGRTIVAVYGACDDLHVKSHRHAALNSGIVAHNRERLLADPGHSCYRGLVHGMETQTQTHNTVTFSVGEGGEGERQEDKLRFVPLQQHVDSERRRLVDGVGGPLLAREGERLIAASDGPVRVIGHDAAVSYGDPITEASRFWILCGTHALFVVDRFTSTRPAKAIYNWVLDNRDGLLEFKPVPPDRIVVRRGTAGMKLFHLGGGGFGGPVYSFMHDAYHPLPAQRGEGASGTGLIVRWTDTTPATTRTTVHAIALDSYGAVAGWHLRDADTTGGRLELGTSNWECRVADDGVAVTDHASGTTYRIAPEAAGAWTLRKE